MNLKNGILTFNLNDTVSFYPYALDAEGYLDIKTLIDTSYITGVIVGLTESNHIDLIIKTEFAYYTVPASKIHQVNNLCLTFKGFNKSLKYQVAI